MFWYLDHDAGIEHVLCGFFSKLDADSAAVSCDRNRFYGHCNSASHYAAAYEYTFCIESGIKRIIATTAAMNRTGKAVQQQSSTSYGITEAIGGAFCFGKQAFGMRSEELWYRCAMF